MARGKVTTQDNVGAEIVVGRGQGAAVTIALSRPELVERALLIRATTPAPHRPRRGR